MSESKDGGNGVGGFKAAVERWLNIQNVANGNTHPGSAKLLERAGDQAESDMKKLFRQTMGLDKPDKNQSKP